MGMPDRFIARGYMIDANRANARGVLEAMNQLQKWAEGKVIDLIVSDTARGEIARGGSLARARRAQSLIYTQALNTTDEEGRIMSLIEATLSKGGAKDANQRNDVDIVFQSWKYKYALVTNDGGSRRQPGGMLGNRERLRELGIEILTDEEAVSQVRELIRVRDDRAMWWHNNYGLPLPNWVGMD